MRKSKRDREETQKEGFYFYYYYKICDSCIEIREFFLFFFFRPLLFPHVYTYMYIYTWIFICFVAYLQNVVYTLCCGEIPGRLTSSWSCALNMLKILFIIIVKGKIKGQIFHHWWWFQLVLFIMWTGFQNKKKKNARIRHFSMVDFWGSQNFENIIRNLIRQEDSFTSRIVKDYKISSSRRKIVTI